MSYVIYHIRANGQRERFNVHSYDTIEEAQEEIEEYCDAVEVKQESYVIVEEDKRKVSDLDDNYLRWALDILGYVKVKYFIAYAEDCSIVNIIKDLTNRCENDVSPEDLSKLVIALIKFYQEIKRS